MENWLQTLREFWGYSSAWIEGFYKDNTGLLAMLAVIFAGAGTLFAYRAHVKRKPTPTKDPSTHLDPALRLRLLDRVQKDRVEPRLRQGLRDAIRVDLGLTETPGAVQSKLRLYAQQESGLTAERAVQGPIQHIFEQTAGGRLLILGEPGTGKTNLLLELAQSLIAEAKQNETRPIPIIFSLPRWTLGKRVRTIGEWLKDDLAAEYGLSRAAAEALVQQDSILPLLDGLDEVAQDRRTACVDAIHAYQQSRNLGWLAVCCRVAEYADLPHLDLRAAIRVERLTREDVEREISKPGLEYVRRALDGDPELRTVVDTPLWLHVLYGAAQIEFSSGSEKPPLRERLYARYVEYALGRKADGSPRRRTTREPLLHRLGWLAAEMRRRDQAQFAFEDLDLSWLPARRAQRAARWVAVLVGGLFGGGLLVGLFGEMEAGVEAIEELRFSWREAKAGLLVGLVGGVAGGLVGGPLVGLVIGLVSGLVIGPVGVLGSAFQPQPVTEHSAPNRGTLRSLHYALWIALSGWTLLALLVIASQAWLSGDIPKAFIAFSIASLSPFPVLLSLHKGGLFALRHYTVRLFLSGLHFAPLRYGRFLSEAAGLFLIRRGGSRVLPPYLPGLHGRRWS